MDEENSTALFSLLAFETSKQCLEFYMPDQNQMVGYVFSYLSKTIKSNDGLGNNAWIRRQSAILTKYASENSIQIARLILKTSTYRGKSFVEFAEFDAAVSHGLASSNPVVIADLRELLRRTDVGLTLKVINKLDQVQVAIIDASTGEEWKTLADSVRQSIILEAAHAHHSRSLAIKNGQVLKGKKRGLPPEANRLLGAKANRVSAENRAAELAPFVATLEEALLPGAKLSASFLARQLTEAGIRAARSPTWSPNAAQNLLDRLKR
jgi:hypothetical protein